jgi:hypothetical protein
MKFSLACKIMHVNAPRFHRDRTTHIIFAPRDFIARLVPPVLKPRANRMRQHGIFAPNSHLRAPATPGWRGGR